MVKVNLGRLLLAAVVTFVAFIATEFVIENFVYFLFNVSEHDLWVERAGVVLSGFKFHVLNLSLFLGICVVIMSVYALIRPSFDSTGKTVIAASAVTLLLFFLTFGTFVNMGVFSLEMMLLSLAFNLVETPVAVLAGASVYEGRQGDAVATA